MLNNDVYYEMRSPMEAVDSCFKCIKGLYNINNFGKTSPHIWYFIEQYVFGIRPDANHYAATTDLINDLKRH